MGLFISNHINECLYRKTRIENDNAEKKGFISRSKIL